MRLYIIIYLQILFASSALGNDTIRIKALMDSAQIYSYSELDKSLSIYASAALLSLKSNEYALYIDCKKNIMFVSLTKNKIDIYAQNLKIFENTLNQYGAYLGSKLEQSKLDLLTAKVYLCGMIGDYKKSSILLEEKYRILTKTFPDQQKQIFNTLINIGGMEMQLGNYQIAEEYYQKALSYQNLYFPNNYLQRMITYNLLGLCNFRIKKYKEAETFYCKALEEKTKSAKESFFWNRDNQILVGDLYYGISEVYFEQNLLNKASINLDSAFYLLNKYKIINGRLIDCYRLQGKIFIKKGMNQNALNCFNISLNLIRSLYGNKHYFLSEVYCDQAKIYAKQQNVNKSLQLAQSALISLSQNFESTDWRNNPSVSDVFSKKNLLETLDFKAGLLLNLAQSQPQYLIAAYNTAQLAAGLIDIIRTDYTSDLDKQYLAEWSYGVYEKAINSAYFLYEKTKDAQYINSAFNALERSKSIVLLEALKSGKAEAALSNDDREQLYLLKAQLQKLEQQIYEATTQNKKAIDDPSVRALQNSLFDTRRQYEALVKSFETLYPDYYKVKYNPTFAQLKEVQQRLPKDGSAIILEYFVGDHDIYTFLITRNTCEIFKKEKPKDIVQRIEMLRQAVINENPQSSTQFIHQATWFYDLILRDPLERISRHHALRDSNLPNSKVKKLIIIPDGILSYVPFEMLFDGAGLDKHQWSDMPFLINQYAISYANSGNLLNQQMHPKEQQARNLFAGFAAQYKPNDAPLMAMRVALTRDNAYDLPHALKEVEAIQALIGGMLFTKAQSNERNFKIFANQYRIIHCAMHAVPDSLNPMLSKLLFTYNSLDTLEDNDLTAAELYTMHLNADMAILSACQTGYGIINRGEGVMSLSRAFAYAGVPATIMSLWKVPDNTTSEIMIEFYKNLKKRQPKDEALRNAKLHYLKHHEAEEDLQNPLYWAGFVAVGNMTPIDMTPPYQNFMIGSLILLAFVGLVYTLRQWQYRAL